MNTIFMNIWLQCYKMERTFCKYANDVLSRENSVLKSILFIQKFWICGTIWKYFQLFLRFVLVDEFYFAICVQHQNNERLLWFWNVKIIKIRMHLTKYIFYTDVQWAYVWVNDVSLRACVRVSVYVKWIKYVQYISARMDM